MADSLPHMLRSDARDNRDRVLDAARELFADRGLDVPMREIARRAQVGPATLYRRFATKQALIDAAFAAEMQACVTLVRDGCADPDPWRGLCSIVQGATELNARSRGFVDALSSVPDGVSVPDHRRVLLRSVEGLCRRAIEAGALRPDFVLDDLVLMLLAARGLPVASLEDRLAAARRFAGLALEAFRAASEAGPLPPPARLIPAMLPSETS
ncbi:AcrR family transcriptional regulator [Actinoplanes lutulentus]|uniref:TetR family transcriptional regulator n=1 Tax=Actinoplanes lutulentus TaxID=1287878 RepID=A0A327Z4L9_9ACTN|nr:TetR/AcrR family transcriptional regulator [Actinoplanes lutulentus]MBB2948778.1 AcrR family transcriptional regulator [Actinoplanes lutulentus]RAK29690.1 TetR family transcriptional regulator [Actinoplanes lutulentus]